MASIRKSRTERLEELEASLRLIHNCTKHFHETRDQSYLLGVLSQLRALVSFNPSEPSNRRKRLKPLLLDLADQESIPLRLFSAPPKPENGPPGLAASILAFKTWSVDAKQGHVLFDLKQWLLAPAFHVDSKNVYKPRNDVIRQLTEKGAVHYDEDVGEIVDSMRRTFGSRYSGVEFFIVDTACAVFYLGTRYLRISKLRAAAVDDPECHESIVQLDREFENVKISMM